MSHPRLFPVFLKLDGRRVVVVGAGKVAASKLAALRDAGAEIVVVAPDVHESIEAAGVAVERREFRPSDLDGAWYVVAAATPEVNRVVAAAAAERRLFVNAVDDKASASAYLGSVLERGGVTVAFSTEGEAPAIAGLVREGVDALLPRDVDRWMQEAATARASWKAAGVPMERRRPLLLQALNRIYDGAPSGQEGLVAQSPSPPPGGEGRGEGER